MRGLYLLCDKFAYNLNINWYFQERGMISKKNGKVWELSRQISERGFGKPFLAEKNNRGFDASASWAPIKIYGGLSYNNLLLLILSLILLWIHMSYRIIPLILARRFVTDCYLQSIREGDLYKFSSLIFLPPAYISESIGGR